MRQRLLLVASLVVAALVGAACGTVSPYAAKVNGVRIGTDALERELEAVRGNKAYLEALEGSLAPQGLRVQGAGKGTFSTSFVSQVLSRRILLQLVHEEVQRRKLRVGDDERRAARSQLEESFGDARTLSRFPRDFLAEMIQWTAEVNVLQEALSRGGVSEAEVRRFYDENPTFFEQACARHIVTGGFEPGAAVSPEQDAQAKAAADNVVRRLAAGEDFAAIARAESKDAESAAQGGDLGCGPSQQFPAVVAGKLGELQPGQVGGPMRGDVGWHVVQLVERRTQPLEEAAEQIRAFLQQQQDPLEAFIRSAVEKADISVNPRYGRFDRAQLSVVPPEAPATSVPGPGPADPADPAEDEQLQR